MALMISIFLFFFDLLFFGDGEADSENVFPNRFTPSFVIVVVAFMFPYYLAYIGVRWSLFEGVHMSGSPCVDLETWSTPVGTGIDAVIFTTLP